MKDEAIGRFAQVIAQGPRAFEHSVETNPVHRRFATS